MKTTQPNQAPLNPSRWQNVLPIRPSHESQYTTLQENIQKKMQLYTRKEKGNNHWMRLVLRSRHFSRKALGSGDTDMG